MKITLVNKIRDAKQGRLVTEGREISIEDIQEDNRYSVRLVRPGEKKGGRIIKGISGTFLRKYIELGKDYNEAYICKFAKEDESNERVEFTSPHFSQYGLIQPQLNVNEGVY